MTVGSACVTELLACGSSPQAASTMISMLPKQAIFLYFNNLTPDSRSPIPVIVANIE